MLIVLLQVSDAIFSLKIINKEAFSFYSTSNKATYLFFFIFFDFAGNFFTNHNDQQKI